MRCAHTSRGEADVEQVLQRRPPDRRSERDREVPHRRGRSPSSGDRLRADSGELRHDLVVGEVGALADLHFVHAVDPVVRVDVPVHGDPAPQLMQELRERRLGVAGTEHVQGDACERPTRCSRSAGPTRRRSARPSARRSDGTPPRRGPWLRVVRSVRASSAPSPSCRVVEIEIGESVEMPCPAVAARVVADLRVDQARDHRDEAVDVGRCLPSRPRRAQRPPGASTASAIAYDAADGCETGDRAMEQQLGAGRILDREGHERSHEHLDRVRADRPAARARRAVRRAGGCRRRTSRRRARASSRSTRTATAGAYPLPSPTRGARLPPTPWTAASFHASATIAAVFVSRRSATAPTIDRHFTYR